MCNHASSHYKVQVAIIFTKYDIPNDVDSNTCHYDKTNVLLQHDMINTVACSRHVIVYDSASKTI
jgi:hypothetical protein